jgi:ABC-type bacteriocin/lantibiotic exporter with double-glycine peptidase domain
MVATGLLAIGGILVMEQLMNIGQFVAAEIIILLLMNSVEKLVTSLETIYDVLTSLEKIGQVTDMELEKDDGVAISHDHEKGMDIELTEVHFTYPGNTEKTIHDFSLSIASGEKVVLTGKGGSGKSSLLHLLAGLYDVQHGSIAYDNFPKGNLELSALRSVIGDFMAHEQIFEGTLFENISMGRDKADMDNVRWAIHHCGLEGFVKSLPQGYNSMLEPMGKKLPKGTVLKILVARAIADRPRLLLLEDNFEYQEDTDRKQIIDFLTSKDNPWTLVAVSNDPYFLSKADRVVVIEKGNVLKQGKLSDIGHLIK